MILAGRLCLVIGGAFDQLRAVGLQVGRHRLDAANLCADVPASQPDGDLIVNTPFPEGKNLNVRNPGLPNLSRRQKSRSFSFHIDSICGNTIYQFCGMFLQKGFQLFNPHHSRHHGPLPLILEHLVMDQPPSWLDNVNVPVIELPDLPSGQLLRRFLFFNLHVVKSDGRCWRFVQVASITFL
jgi:hypothetical protein